ncbi:hypothetical protein M758_3G153300 [Ceratodon purpureus]|nr:hypothetical protein M758_3G153300 [Ceratodon purpureus]
MPRLREAKIPFGLKAYKNFLKLANVANVIFGILTVVMSFEINPIPTFSPGWLLILLGATTMMGGMTGFGGTTLPCCYKSHVILMCISIFGTGVFCLCMFGQRPKVVASFKSTRFPEATVDEYISSISWVYVFVVIIECVALVARIFFQRMAAREQFETLEQTQDFREMSMGKMRQDLGGS